MFRIPSSVMSQLRKTGIAITSRYVYALFDYSSVSPGLHLCTRVLRRLYDSENIPSDQILRRTIYLED